MRSTLIAIAALFALFTVSFTGCVEPADDPAVQRGSEASCPPGASCAADEPPEASGGVCGPLVCAPKTHGCNCACDNAACVPDGFECADVCISTD